MSQVGLDFEWQRDAKGYRLVEVPRTRTKSVYRVGIFTFPGVDVSKTIAGQHSADDVPLRIERRRGRLTPYRPIETFDSLCTIFANQVRDAESLLQFVEKFGPLTKEGLDADHGEAVAPIIRHADAMRQYLVMAAGNRSRFLEWLESTHGGVPLTVTTVKLAYGPGDASPTLRFSPNSLMDALWLQLGHLLMRQGTVHQCGYCHDWFKAGPEGQRRRYTKFCSEKCKIRFHSLKRSEGRK